MTTEATESTTGTRVPPRLKTRYREEILPALHEQFGYANVMQVPGLTKIVVNMGVGEAARDSKLIEGAVNDLTAITGQKPQVTKARKSIAQFKLREGMPIGAHVTLRGDRMWEFLDRLVSIGLSRRSSVPDLNARPTMPTRRRPARKTASMPRSTCCSFAGMIADRSGTGRSWIRAAFVNARTSFGRQEPPKAKPGLRYASETFSFRSTRKIRITSWASAPSASHRSATSLVKHTFRA